MPLDLSTATDVGYAQAGASLNLTWTSSAPPRTTFQVYVNRALAWHGIGNKATIPIPPSGAAIDIGSVGAGEDATDFSSSLPVVPRNRAELSWLGGSFEGADILGFRVYGETTAGGGIDYNTPLATLDAYAQGLTADGFGVGGFGLGGFGASAGSYSWTSEPYRSGTWAFAVVPYDSAGNEGNAVTTTVYLVAPPAPVPVRTSGNRLDLTYNATTKQATLTWTASPG